MSIAYDGTAYGGWQIQPNAMSIQELIQNALKTILRHDVNLIGSGRTDAGVHALQQVAHFHTEQEVDIYRLTHSLNGILPRDIRILDIAEVPLTFHAQRNAIKKTYHYHLCLHHVQSPFRRLYSYHVREKIDLELLNEAAQMFVGTHDFTSFANEAHAGAAAKHAVRTLYRVDCIPEEDGMRIELEANGFLYKMVRNIVGTLLEVAEGKRPKEDIPRIFTAKDRREAGQAAPAHALFLAQVTYKGT